MQARYRLDLADRFAVNSATARQFAANPSDPTSRWAPCPARSDRSEHSTHQQLALRRQQALIPAVSQPGAHLPLPMEPHLHPVLVLRSSCARRGITPAFGYGPRLGSVRLDFHQLATRPARRALRPLLTSPRRAAPSRPPPSRTTPRTKRTGHLGHPWRSPRVRPATFLAHPPRLRNGPLMDIGLRHAVPARPDRPAFIRAAHRRRTATARHVFLGSRLRLRLPSHPASRRAVAIDLWLVPSTSTGDSHPRAAGHAGRTRGRDGRCWPPPAQNRVEARLALAPPTPPGMRVRTGRFAQHPWKRR